MGGVFGGAVGYWEVGGLRGMAGGDGGEMDGLLMLRITGGAGGKR